MVRAIGFRVEPQTVNYAVVEGTKKEPILILCNKISPPKSYDQESSQLVWYRERLLTIIEQYQPQYAAIRFPEPNSFGKTKVEPLLKRARIEGVILESLGREEIECKVAALTKISSEINSKSARQYLDNDDFRNLDWSNIKNRNQREAILVAVTQLED